MVIQSELVWLCSATKMILSERDPDLDTLRFISERGMVLAERAKSFPDKFVSSIAKIGADNAHLVHVNMLMSSIFDGMKSVFERAYMLSLSGIGPSTDYIAPQLCMIIQSLLDTCIRYNKDWIDPHACSIPMVSFISFGNSAEVDKCDSNPVSCWGVYDNVDAAVALSLYGEDAKLFKPEELHAYFNVPEWEAWAHLHYTAKEESLRHFSYKKACETILVYARAITDDQFKKETEEIDSNIKDFGDFGFTASGILINRRHGVFAPGLLADDGQLMRLRADLIAI